MENDKDMVICINDAQLLRKLAQLARQRKAGNKSEFIKKLFTKAARVRLGLDTDLSPVEVAGQLGCHVNTIKNYIKARRFPHMYYTSSRRVRIPVADVEALSRGTIAV